MSYYKMGYEVWNVLPHLHLIYVPKHWSHSCIPSRTLCTSCCLCAGTSEVIRTLTSCVENFTSCSIQALMSQLTNNNNKERKKRDFGIEKYITD